MILKSFEFRKIVLRTGKPVCIFQVFRPVLAGPMPDAVVRGGNKG